MKLEKIDLLKNSKEYRLALLFFLIIFLLNLSYTYIHYLEFKKDKVYEGIYTVLNIYPKQNSNILKLKDSKISFYTKVKKNSNYFKYQKIRVLIINKNISFYLYLKGFYANIILIKEINNPLNLRMKLSKQIKKQHINEKMSSLYESIFLALPLDKDIRVKIASFGISHLFAISGFHLGVIVIVLYFIFNVIYKNIHQTLWPYRNKRLDILVFISICLFFYLLLIDLVPSFLRAFIMFLFAFILLRCNIMILSFKSLLFTVLLILSLYPKYIFSLSLLFSLTGVFFIFLYIQYFKNMNKILSFLLFNIWIFASLNPIIHYFFPISSIYQLYSPIISLLFILFYPLVLFFHFISFGFLFDNILLNILSVNIDIYQYQTNIYFMYVYIFIAFLSIKNIYSFYLLNILMLVFNIHLFFLF